MTTTQQQNPAAITARRGGGNDLKGFLDSPAVRAKLAEAAGEAMKPEDLIRLALMAASRSPELAKCTRESVLRSLLDAAALGIQPGGLMGRGYLVPRKNKKNGTVECSFDPGWRGLVDIARRSGQILRIEAHVVHEKDDFEIIRTPLTTIRHKECEEDNPGEVTHAYAAAEFRNGSVQIEIVKRRDIDKIRKMGAEHGPWASWFDEMARKTAVRRLCKYLPFDPLLDKAMQVSDKSDAEAALHVEARPVRKSLKDKLAANSLSESSMLPEVEEDAEEDAAPAPADEMDPEPQESIDAGRTREPGEEG